MKSWSDPPLVWGKLGRFCHQDFLEIYSSLEHGIDEFLKSVSSGEIDELVEYLNYLVEYAPGGDARVAWSKSGAQFGVSKPKEFLSNIMTIVKENIVYKGG